MIKHPVGTKLTKFFNDGRLWTGTVTGISDETRHNVRLIQYSDGDNEQTHITEIDALHRLYNRPDDFAFCATVCSPPDGWYDAHNPAHFAGSAVAIDGMVTPSSYKAALNGPDSALWTEAS